MHIIQKNTKYNCNHIAGGINMDEQTRKLLEECSVGCRMAVESFEQIKEYVKEYIFLVYYGNEADIQQ